MKRTYNSTLTQLDNLCLTNIAQSSSSTKLLTLWFFEELRLVFEGKNVLHSKHDLE